jgi:transcriptional regulator with XRE-family HTH domain
VLPPRPSRTEGSAASSGPHPLSHVSDKSRAGARRLAFASFVRRALESARTTRAWNGSEVARRTGVSRQTINRWMRGDWVSDPEPERVAAFCTGLGLDPSAAFGILGWDRSSTVPPEPGPAFDPDIEALLRRLADPDVSDAEKFHIRETVRYLAYRPPLRIGGGSRPTARALAEPWAETSSLPAR